MYSKQEASHLRQQFWTRFGIYMRLVPGASGEPVNWINYRTGIPSIFFRMEAGRDSSTIAIELNHTDEHVRYHYYAKLEQVRAILEQETGELWEWKKDIKDENGQLFSSIGTKIDKVNVYEESDWAVIISFLKPRIIALDRFWELVKEGFG